MYIDLKNGGNKMIIDGEDYAIAIKNLEGKYGKDKDIETIINFCEQWQKSYERMNVYCAELTTALTKIDSIIKNADI